ncbi:Rad21/Rec8 N terminal domain-containing protein [Blumeria hordei DH14]|uniref:Rad21/Rec8 N terminal domain-containing protein n=1 Tax=Blumeria graminis f. sp. hordei (strain DH14) TaxID=546991 RepID=N1JHU0_BLUG1|nr:Rad21/Rec8 N terminal domain-containing protein [Blumeria hordei DH14]
MALQQSGHRLVATLGSKSRTKKVTRKAILGVNLKKACETIIEPEAPMALRLQSNLLYGVTRVYTQKWDYLLTDAQAVHYNIRSFFRTSQGHQIDKNAGKARPEQLVLADDPAFVVDSLLVPPPLDFDGMGLGNSHGSAQSIFSIPQRRDSAISDDNSSVIGLNIPTSSHDGMSPYHAPSHKSIGDSAMAEEGVSHKAVAEDEENLLLQNDDLFEIDDDGIIRELTGHEERRYSFDSISPRGAGHIRKMHPDGTVGQRFPDASSTSRNVIHNNVANEYMSESNLRPRRHLSLVG